MPRRVDLPGASELFRRTSETPAPPEAAGRPEPTPAPAQVPAAGLSPEPTNAEGDGAPRVTGRIRHEEKITVYVSSEELVALEQLRLTLRARHGVAVDRGRIVRAAIADALADVADQGGQARLIQRLTGS